MIQRPPSLYWSHAFPHCEVCGAAVDDPEAMETCAGPVEVTA